MRDKKGFMLGEYTLKVIIAVICLLLLFYLLFKVYSSYRDSKELDMAKATLEELSGKMNLAKESGESSVIILNPNNWWVIAWPYQNENQKPKKCFGEFCICICKTGLGRTNSLSKCDELGVCNTYSERIITLESDGRNLPILIKNPPVEINIKHDIRTGFTLSKK